MNFKFMFSGFVALFLFFNLAQAASSLQFKKILEFPCSNMFLQDSGPFIPVKLEDWVWYDFSDYAQLKTNKLVYFYSKKSYESPTFNFSPERKYFFNKFPFPYGTSLILTDRKTNRLIYQTDFGQSAYCDKAKNYFSLNNSESKLSFIEECLDVKAKRVIGSELVVIDTKTGNEDMRIADIRHAIWRTDNRLIVSNAPPLAIPSYSNSSITPFECIKEGEKEIYIKSVDLAIKKIESVLSLPIPNTKCKYGAYQLAAQGSWVTLHGEQETTLIKLNENTDKIEFQEPIGTNPTTAITSVDANNNPVFKILTWYGMIGSETLYSYNTAEKKSAVIPSTKFPYMYSNQKYRWENSSDFGGGMYVTRWSDGASGFFNPATYKEDNWRYYALKIYSDYVLLEFQIVDHQEGDPYYKYVIFKME